MQLRYCHRCDGVNERKGSGAERRASGAPESGSAADAVGRRLDALVSGSGGYAVTHVEGTWTDRAFLAILAGRPWGVVTVPALVLCARW